MCVHPALPMPATPARVASLTHTEQQQQQQQEQQQQLTLSEAQLKSLLDASAAQAAAATAAAVSAATPAPAAPMKTPPEVYAALAADGVKRCTEIPLFKLLVLSVYAGVYVSFGGFVATSVVNILPGLSAAHPGLAKLVFSALFPVGLMVTILHGAELFTGNTMKATMALCEGKIKLSDLARNWAVSWAGNFIGSLAVLAVVLATGLLPAGSAAPIKVALAKTSLSFGEAFSRAVLANWFVCLAVWCATASSSLPGKLMAIWPPILSFCAFGGEHSIANMFLIPLGTALGADVSMQQFLVSNLLPVTLGNTVAGAMCMAAASAFFYSQRKPAAKAA